MTRNTFHKALLALTISCALAACSSDDDPVAAPDDNMSGTGDMSGNEGDGGAGMNPGTPTVDLATTPVFMTTTCDAAPAPEGTATSSIATAPASFLPDTLVEGRLDPDSTSNAEHYWAVDLEAGIYHLIVEDRLSSGVSSNIGLMVESTDSSGNVVERLIRSNELDYRIRDLNTVTLTAAQTLRLKVTPLFDQEDYLMGIFRNGTPVASPWFNNCPQISPLALDTTQAFELNTAGEAGANEVWFQSALELADYTLAASAAVVSGDSTNIIFSARTYTQFGQIGSEETVIGTNEINTMFDASGDFQPSDAGPHWIRFRNRVTPVDLSVTLTQN